MVNTPRIDRVICYIVTTKSAFCGIKTNARCDKSCSNISLPHNRESCEKYSVWKFDVKVVISYYKHVHGTYRIDSDMTHRLNIIITWRQSLLGNKRSIVWLWQWVYIHRQIVSKCVCGTIWYVATWASCKLALVSITLLLLWMWFRWWAVWWWSMVTCQMAFRFTLVTTTHTHTHTNKQTLTHQLSHYVLLLNNNKRWYTHGCALSTKL